MLGNLPSFSTATAAVFPRSDFKGISSPYTVKGSSRGDVQEATTNALPSTSPVNVGGSLFSEPYLSNATARLASYSTFMNFYAGRHHTSVPLSGLRHVHNFPRRIADKRASWAAGARPGFYLRARKGNELVCEILSAVWNANRGRQLVRRSAKSALVCGDAFWYITVKEKIEQGVTKKVVRINPVNPSYVFPIWSEEDPSVMSACVLQFPVQDKALQYTFTAVYTPERVKFYRNEELTSETVNSLGLIPIVHIANAPFDDLALGVSSLVDVIPHVNPYNEAVEQVGRILRFFADPTTVVTGADYSSVQKAGPKLWAIPDKEARVNNLELRGDLASSFKLLDLLEDAMLCAGRTPRIAYDARSLATSNSSGLAIQLLFQPLIEATDELQEAFSEGIVRANTVIERIYSVVFNQPLSELSDSPDTPLAYDVCWRSIMPRDRKEEIDVVSRLLELKLISRAEAMRRVGEITDTRRNAVELASDALNDLAISQATAQALNGQTFNATAVTLGSIFIGEDLLDIAKDLGTLSSDATESPSPSDRQDSEDSTDSEDDVVS